MSGGVTFPCRCTEAGGTEWGAGRTPSWAPSGSLSPEEDLLSQASHTLTGRGHRRGLETGPDPPQSPPRPALPDQKHLELQERQYLQKAVRTASSVAPAREAEEPSNLNGFGGVDAPASQGRLSCSFPAAVLAGSRVAAVKTATQVPALFSGTVDLVFPTSSLMLSSGS